MTDVSALYERHGGDDGEGDEGGEGAASVVLNVHVSPGAGRSAVVGRHGDALKVRVAAPPVGGRANEATRKLLSETFAVEARDIQLVSGESSRTKRFRLSRVDLEDFERRLHLLVSPEERPRPPT